MDVSNGNNVRLLDCSASSSQIWYASWLPLGTVPPTDYPTLAPTTDTTQIKSKENDGNYKCLTVSSLNEGANVFMDDCNLSNEQLWYHLPYTQEIKLSANNRCLDVYQGLNNDGQNIGVYDCSGHQAQVMCFAIYSQC